MDLLFQRIIDFLLPKNDFFLYIFLFGSSILENLIPPIPGDTITVFGAFLVGVGRLNYWYVFIACTAGSVIGFMMLFFLGRYLEREFFLKKDIAFFRKEQIINAEKWFGRYGYPVLVLNRFLPGLRSVLSIVSGISLLNPLWVFLCALVSASVWNLLWMQTGYLLGNNWEAVKERVADIMVQYNLIALIVIGALIVVASIVIILKKKFAKGK